jgi:predicted MFS family arabinose efflux permease
MTTAELGRYAGLAVGLGGALGTLVGGWLCDKLRARTRNIELKVLAAALAMGLLCLSFTLFSPQRAVALLTMFAFDFCAYAYLGPIVTLIQQEADAGSRALAIALCVSVSNIVNLCLALPAVGWISDTLKAGYGAHAVGYALEIGALAAGALGMLALWRVSSFRNPSRST